ncbi:MAG: gliding motility-associated C-terminal domain-containing protein [Flavobacteriales bacterium]|nr:gliding motility-associated C-terminal domain-containing protein [Flavobacteriales bacterium]
MYKNTLKFMNVNVGFKALFLLTLFASLSSYSQVNLLANGDFEGDGGYDVYNYNNVGAAGNTNPGNYAVVGNAQEINSNFSNVAPQSGTKMLVFDSQLNGGQQHFWRAGVCALSNEVTHTFSFWMRSVAGGERADVEFFTDGTTTEFTQISGPSDNKAPAEGDGWVEYVYTFKPIGNCIELKLRHTNANNYPDGNGRDFAIDNFRLTAPPAPLSISAFTNPASCPNNNDASIEASAFGGDGNYTYTLQGDASATNNTGVFIGLAPGNYTVQVADTNAEVAVTGPIALASPVDITATGDATICSGESTNLSVNGSTSGYTWSSNPNDPSIVDPSLADQTVSPSQTTTYTVSSVITSDALGITNLVTNGDFAQGNVGFDTDYNFRDPNTLKEQKAYGVVSNPKSWEGDFSECTDRSSDNDLMLVVDGSIDAGNNDRIWSQTIPVEPGKDYIFSYWLQNVVSITPPRIETQINGVVVGTELAPAQACGWVRHFYRWNAGVSNTAVISLIDRETALAGNDFAIDDIAFALAVQCTIEKSVTVNVNPQVTATFSFPTNLDLGDVAPVLPASSDNGLTGTWSPLAIDTSVLGDTVYTFTPDNNQCASGDVVVTVNVRDPLKIDPAFTLPASICNGDVAPILPSPSDNGITGSWNPAVVDNTQSGAYLFTPDDLVANNTFTYNLTVNQPTIADFSSLATTICQGDLTFALPLTSDNGIVGTWDIPLDVNTVGPTTYTFSPTGGGCEAGTTFTLNITATTVADFSSLATSTCQGDSTFALPLTSDNGIVGVWDIPLDVNTVGPTTYTFSPTGGGCEAGTTFTLTINPRPGQISLTGMCNGTNYVLTAAPVNGSYDITSVSYVWRDGNGTQVGTNQASFIATAADTYTVEVTNAFGCMNTQSLVVASVFCEIPKGISPETTPGENDTFDLTALAPLHVQIFNRYGYEVFERSNYRNEWNGQTNTGKDLPAGTYYYIVQLQSGETRTGWVYLAR